MDLKEVREILVFPGSLEEGIRLAEEKTLQFQREFYPDGGEVPERPSIGQDGEEILNILFSSNFEIYEEGLVKILSKIAVPELSKGKKMVNPETGEEGWWFPTLFREPDLYKIWKERKLKRGGGKENTVPLSLGSLIILLNRENNHSYLLGEPILVLRDFSDGLYTGISPLGEEGNFLPTERTALRPATSEEIKSFFARVPK